jgi:hypothetical protein
MPIIQLPDGQNAEFPDSMPLDDIKAVIQKKFPPSSTIQQPQDNNLARDIFAGGQGGPQKLADIPGMTDPRQLAKGAIQSAGIIGSAFAPEIPAVMKGAALLPRAINALSRTGTQAGLGAMSTPDQPVLGASLGVLGNVVPNIFSGIKNLIGTTKSAFSKISPLKIGKDIQASHDKLEKSASDLFTQVQDVAKDRNIGLVNIGKDIKDNIGEYINNKYLPNTMAAKKIISNAKEGDYSSLRKLQSELWHRGTAKKSSVIPSDQDTGEEMLEARDILNDKIINHFNKINHPDLAEKLQDAKHIYKNLKDIYYSHPSISKLVDKSTRKIPKNMFSVLSEESNQMRRLRKENPFIEDVLQKRTEKANALKRLKYLGGLGAGAGILGGAASIPTVYHKLSGE